MATTNFGRRIQDSVAGIQSGGRITFLAALLLLGNVGSSGSAGKDSPAARAESAFFQSQARFNKHGSDPEAAWQFGRACFEWADFAESGTGRAEIAEQGIAACRQAIEQAPRIAAAHYYLAMNLGQLARTKKIGALKLVTEMEKEFLTAIELDAKVDFAGAHRCLGLLYLEAPGWPASIGNRSKARAHFLKAVELCPDYPDNILCLFEAYLKWGEKSAVQSHLSRTEEMLQRARKDLTGELWEYSWQDWDRRWDKIKSKASEPPFKLESPRQKK